MPETHLCAAVIATRHRPAPLRRTLESILEQQHLPSHILVVDGSDEGRHDTTAVCDDLRPAFTTAGVDFTHRPAIKRGAASQRNEGVACSEQPFILFLDDDIIIEPHCIERLFNALESDSKIGAVSSMITNQKFERPGIIGRIVGRLVSSSKCQGLEWAGRYLGPCMMMLPADDDSLPDVVSVEWVNAGCTLYKSEALPDPPFPNFFTGASFAEDFTLSQIIRRDWDLVNARTARIFHDSQPGDHKQNTRKIAEETAANWRRIMHQVTRETRRRDAIRLALTLVYRAIGNACGPAGFASLQPTFLGYIDGWKESRRSS